MNNTPTNRGFDLMNFTDRSGHECSLQKSSTEDCIRLGVNDGDPRHLIPGMGWVKIELPDDILITTRMHLTREMVKELLPYLERFAETGELT